eukprot:990678-Prorocentrum_minimum.AAC.5
MTLTWRLYKLTVVFPNYWQFNELRELGSPITSANSRYSRYRQIHEIPGISANLQRALRLSDGRA